MAVGVPVLASPIPSYAGSPAILINGFGEEWHTEIKKIVNDKKYYQELSEKGITYCQSNFSTNIIMSKYQKLFNDLI